MGVCKILPVKKGTTNGFFLLKKIPLVSLGLKQKIIIKKKPRERACITQDPMRNGIN